MWFSFSEDLPHLSTTEHFVGYERWDEPIDHRAQLELKRRQDEAASSSSLERSADRQARADRPRQVTEPEEEIKREQLK